MDTPAGSSSGSSPTPQREQSPATGPGAEPEGAGQDAGGFGSFELPNKLRVHALAKLLGSTSREIITVLDQLGAPVRSAQSNLTRDVALQVVRSLRPEQLEDPEAEDSGSARPAEPASSGGGDAAPGSAAGKESPGQEDGDQETQPEGERATNGQEAGDTALNPVFAAPQAMFLAPDPAQSAPAKGEPTGADQSDADADEQESTTEAAAEVDDSEADVEADSETGATDEGDQSRRRRRRGRRGRGRGRGADGESTLEEQEPAASSESGPDSGGPDKDKNGSEKGGSDKGKGGSEKSGSDKDKGGSDKGGSPDRNGRSKKDGSASGGNGDDAGQQSKNGQSQGSDDPEEASRRRRRRRRRKGSGEDDGSGRTDDPPNTVVHVRENAPENGRQESGEDEVRSVKGSTRLEAKRQRRRDGREAGRRRAPVLSESEFLARRESVDRRMVVRESGEQTQIAVLEDEVLVENFVTSSGSGSLVGNVYLGRVQNVLPSMEAAFVDIGRGRNAVLYAGEVDWDAAGLAGKARRIEQALSTGDSVLVQVTKDPVGHKGARLTTQVSLPGRFLVYVPGGGATGISRKLPDNERKRLKEILKRIVPENSGVIIRTASEGTSEQALDRDVRRLQAQWDVIKEKAETPKAQAPQLLYEEPDLLIKVVRDLFTEDFSSLTVQGNDSWDTIEAYVQHVAPDLVSRLHKHVGKNDVFTEQRINEQIAKALDRKVWLPSGGYLVVDRTEAMTVIDVNTGKYTGSGGNLEETVTRNNLEAAEEIVRQLRLRDVGGIIVIDFIDMVLESNRDLVLRRLTECLGRDRTRHQVAEVTSLGLVQMTRKRVGTGLLEAYSNTCEHCRGRGLLVSTEPVVHSHDHGGNGGSKRKRDRGKQSGQEAHADSGSSKGGGDRSQSEQAPAKGEHSKGEHSKGESSKGESSKGESSKGQPLKGEHSKGEQAKAESPKGESPKGQPSKGEQAKAEPSKGAPSKSGEQAKSGEIKHGAKNDETKSGEAKSGEAKSGEVKSGEVKSGEVKSGEVKTGAIKTGEIKPGQPQETSQDEESRPGKIESSPAQSSGAAQSSGVAQSSGAAPAQATSNGADDASARPKRRKVSRPTSSVGSAPASVVLDQDSDQEKSAPPAPAPAPVTAAPAPRARRRSSGRPAGPPPAEESQEESGAGSGAQD